MHRLPFGLIYTRLLLGLSLIVLSITNTGSFKLLAIIFLTVGLLTDIFDGIIARRLQVSSQKLRRLDSTIDQIFFISVAVATYIQRPEFFTSHAWKMGILLGAEALTYILSFVKFRKEIATHTIGAKIWTLLLFVVLIEVIAHSQSAVMFELAFWVGMITRIEIIAITLTLKQWTNDVPTWYHALQLRRGKDIKRNKLFNG